MGSHTHAPRRGDGTRGARRENNGFTLVELLVVVVHVGILLAVALPLYLSAAKNAAQQTAKANLKIVAAAAQAYKAQQSAYPDDFDGTGTPPSAFIGTGNDLTVLPDGPRSLGYTWRTSTDVTAPATATGQLIVTATESAIGEDVFGDPATIESLHYNLSTGTYTVVAASNSSGTSSGGTTAGGTTSGSTTAGSTTSGSTTGGTTTRGTTTGGTTTGSTTGNNGNGNGNGNAGGNGNGNAGGNGNSNAGGNGNGNGNGKTK